MSFSIFNLKPVLTLTTCLLCALLMGNLVSAEEFLQRTQQADLSVWVVSSRELSQRPTGKALSTNLDYYYTTGNGTLQAVTQNQFTQSLQPGVPCCLFVHGSFMRWSDIMLDSQLVAEWVRAAKPNRPIQIIYYTWPSEGYLTMLPQVDIGILGRRGEFNGLYLTQVISQVPRETPLLLMGHSFGCRAITASLHLLGGGVVQNYRLPAPQQDQHRLRALLVAAAIDHHWLNPGERYGNSLCRAEHLVSLRNREDAALSLYPLRRMFARGALGRDGFKAQDLVALGGLKQKVSELDVTQAIRHGHGWPHYHRQQQIARSLGDYMFFAEPQTENAVSVQGATTIKARQLKNRAQLPLRETYSNIHNVSVMQRR